MVAPISHNPPAERPLEKKDTTTTVFETVKGKTKAQELEAAKRLQEQQKQQALRNQGQPHENETLEKSLAEGRHTAEQLENKSAENQAQMERLVDNHETQETIKTQREAVQKTVFLSKDNPLEKARKQTTEQSKAAQDKFLGKTAAGGWTPLNSKHTPPPLRNPENVAKLQQFLPPSLTPKSVAPKTPVIKNPETLVLRYLPKTTQPLIKNHFSTAAHLPQGANTRFTIKEDFRPRMLFQPRQILRSLEPARLMQLAQKVEGEGDTAFKDPTHKTKIAVVIRSPLVFVKDGSQLRAFRILKDGSLEEIPSPDASEKELSPEAKAALQKALAKKNLGSKLASSEEEALAHLEGEQTEALAKELSMPEQALDFETKFTLMLYEVLEKERQVAQTLEGADPEFLTKEDWNAFFQKLMNAGNQEKNAKNTLDKIISLLFRGSFKKETGQDFLVGDLKFLKGAKAKEEKFTQIPLTTETIEAMLKELQPGKTLSQETLQKMFGDEIAFIKMSHVELSEFAIASGAEAKIQFDPKKSNDPYLQARIEQHIFKNKDSAKTPPLFLGQEDPVLFNQGRHGFIANIYELINIKRRFAGKPRILIFLAYLLGFITLAMIISYLL